LLLAIAEAPTMKNSKDGWEWTEIDFAKWRGAVNRRLKDIYAIGINDAGIDDAYLKSHWEEKEPPFEFVLWFGNKYDLDPRGVFGHLIK
jgi:hypothetical protein